MPTQLTPTQFRGPFRGMNDYVSSKQLGEGVLADGLNVVLEGGSIRPRPGYELLSEQISSSPLLIKTGLSSIRDFAWSSDNWFWVDNVGLKIAPRGAKGSSAIATLSQCRSITYDSASDTAYIPYGTYEVRKVSAISTSPSGSDLLTIGSGNNLWDAALDVANDKIYILQLLTGTGVRVYSATLSTGADLTLLATVTTATFASPIWLRFDVTNQKIYLGSVTAGIYRLDADGSNGTLIYAGSFSANYNMSGLAIDEAGGKLYYTTQTISGTQPTEGVYSIDTDRTDNTLLAKIEFDTALGDVHFDATNKRIYFSIGDGRIYQANAPTTSARILSMFSLERGLIGVEDGTFADDWILGQLFNESTSETDFISWFPATNQAWMMPLGYHAAEGTRPELIITNDRDTDPDVDYGFQSGFGVADFAYTGTALNTTKGGVLIANGEGNGFVANYVMGNHIARLNYTAAGNAYLVINGVQTALITDTTTEEDLRQTLVATAGIEQVIVSKTTGTPSGGDPTYFDIEFLGDLAGKSVTLSVVDGTASPTVITQQTGGTETGHKIYLLPCGLPAPDVGDSSHDVQFVQTAAGSPSGNLDGVYEYVASYYSSILGIESPKSVSSGYKDPTAGGANDKILFRINGLPDSLYFQGSTSTIPFLLCDRIRIYRKRLGNLLNGSGEPDGQGTVDQDFYRVADLDVREAMVAGYSYDLGEDDGLSRTDTRAPAYTYPPEGAQYVTIHQNRAHWLPLVDGEQQVYYSEITSNSNQGFQCVRLTSKATLENTRASDHHATSIWSFGSQLIVHTNKDAYIVDTSLLEFDTYVARRLPGGGGCAGKRCVVETDALSELGGRLIWCNGRGDVYAFNGGVVELLSLSILNLTRSLVRKTWQNAAFEETGNDTWYFASAVLDPESRRVIFSTFLDEGADSNSPIQLVFQIDQGESGWTRWNIPGWGMTVIRDLTSSVGKGKAITVFSDAQANLFSLADGKGDNGSTFAWHMLFGIENLGTRRLKNIPYAAFEFESVEYGATAAAPTLTATVKTPVRSVDIAKSPTLDSSGYLEARLDGLGVRTIQFKVSGTQADDQDHPRLVGREFDYEIVGAR